MSKIHNWLIIAFILILTAFCINRLLLYHPKQEVLTEVKYDTIYKEIIIHDTIPQIIEKKIVGKIDTVVEIEHNDTLIPILIDLPKEQKTFTNTLLKDDIKIKYLATISGYKPELDDIDFVITKQDITKTKYKKQYFTHGINVGVGYGFINKKPDTIFWIII